MAQETVGSPISTTLTKQLENRQKYYGTGNRGKNTLSLVNGNSAFVILKSSVNVNGSSGVAENYVLGSNLKGGISKATGGTTGAYNLSSTTGIRPRPAITAVSVA